MNRTPVTCMLGLVVSFQAALMAPAFAAGFGLKEQSALAMGSAYAGTAANDTDASTLSYNPALLSGVKDTDFALSAVEILPQSSALYSLATTSAGTPAGGNAAPHGYISDALVPDFAVRQRIADDWSVGLSVSVQDGLKTNYPSGWAGRYYAMETEAVAVDISPAIAWQVAPELSLGASVNVEYARGVLTSALDIGTIGLLYGIPGAVPGALDGSARLSGIDWATGFSLGALYKPSDDLSLGLSYRSAVHHTLQGPLNFTLDPAGLGAAIRTATGLFADTRASAKLTTPDLIEFGARENFTDAFTGLFEFDWTNWTQFKNLTVVAQNPAQPADVTVGNWNDGYFVSAGGEYRLDDIWKLRGGVGYDGTPIPAATLEPRIPDANRTWLAAGVEYRFTPGTALDFSYGHLFDSAGDINLAASQTGNALRGNLTGVTHSAVNTLGVEISSAL